MTQIDEKTRHLVLAQSDIFDLLQDANLIRLRLIKHSKSNLGLIPYEKLIRIFFKISLVNYIWFQIYSFGCHAVRNSNFNSIGASH